MGATMSGQPRIYLDSDVFITAMETPGAQSDHAWWIIHAVDEGTIIAVTSELTLAEVLVKPMQLNDAEFVAAYEKMIVADGRFEVIPIRRDILVGAARLRARRNSIRLPDAIHIATALATECMFMVSDDQQLHAVDEVKMLGVTPFTVSDILAASR
jgi:predicted nucleic acid-binding protein